MIKQKINNIIIKSKNLFFKNNREANLSQKAVRGGFWVIALKIIAQIFNLLRLIIIARILAPDDFGLMGIAMLVMSILEVFSQTGFQTALIQKKEKIEPYLNSAWSVLILRGFILFIVLYFIAPYAAIFFKAPSAMVIIRVVGLSILLQAFTNIAVVYFQKELEFNKQFFYQLSGILADFVVAVSAVLLLKNVWALVFGLLARDFVKLIVSYFIHPYRPHLDWDLKKIKELFGFGKWILGSSILIFLITQGDDILVGKILGITMLGFYQMAYQISNIPATGITHIISQITFPFYAKLQDDLFKLKIAYLKVLRLTILLSLPIAGLIFILSNDFTKIFLGEKWMPIVPALRVLCVYGIARAVIGTMGFVIYGIGKPKIETQISFIQLIIMAIISYPLIMRWGILGIAIAVTIPSLLSLILITRATKRAIQVQYKDVFISSLAPIVGVLIMILLATFLKEGLFLTTKGIFDFLLWSAFYFIIYLLVVYLVDKNMGGKIKREVQMIFFNLINKKQYPMSH